MAAEDPQDIWSSYYMVKKAQRVAEASEMSKQLLDAGVGAGEDLALDFVHFGTLQANADSLARQLSENYNMAVVEAETGDAWLVKGTTRPYGVTLTQEQHIAWVGFMADVAQSHGCVFSTWSLEAPSLGIRFESEQLSGDT